MPETAPETIDGFAPDQKFRVAADHCIVWPRDARTTAALVEQLAPGELKARVEAGELVPVG
jgi:hypothetical protein